MTSARFRQLQRLARVHGVYTSFLDMHGQKQEAAPEVLAAVLETLGVAAGNDDDVRHALADFEQRSCGQCIEPVIVAWNEQPARIQARIAAEFARHPVLARLCMEDGSTRELSLRANRLRTLRTISAGGLQYAVKELTLPALPLGYHTLEFAVGRTQCRSRIISAPSKSYSDPEARGQWGVFAPMYAAHSEQSWGAGNFSDWQQLGDWLGSLGARVGGTLPLLSAFLDFPVCEPSPYSPASRLFWNEFYVDAVRAPEFESCAAAQRFVRSRGFQERLRAFRRDSTIDYAAQWRARRTVLELLAKSFFAKLSPRRAQFEQFVRNRPEAEDYARFRAACERQKKAWHHWPQRQRNGHLRKGDYDETARRFHLYVQWLAQEQVNQLLEHYQGRGVKFYLDLPLGVNPDGYDAWRERGAFALEASAGAPPDMFFTKGQDWGLPPLHPQRIREQGYQHALDYLRFQMRHTGLLRIDHVMGLRRLYWVPRGFPAMHGAYVGYRAEEWFAILCLESHRHRTTLVGENLGTVPPEVNQAMCRHGLWQMYVVQYEQQPNARAALREPPAGSVASMNTHDMPPFAAHWRGLDIADRVRLGLIPKNQVGRERARRRELNAALIRFLKQSGTLSKQKPGARDVLGACLVWLRRGRAETVLVNLEDLWLEPLPHNVPGTSSERANWRRKARYTIEEIRRRDDVRKALEALERARGRAEAECDFPLHGSVHTRTRRSGG